MSPLQARRSGRSRGAPRGARRFSLGKERDDRGAHCHEDRSQTLSASVSDRLLEGFSPLAHDLDKIKKHYHMADNNTDKACYSHKRHEAEGTPHGPEGYERTCHPIGGAGKNKERFDSIPELEEQGRIDPEHRHDQHESDLTETMVLLCLLSSNLHTVTRGRRRSNSFSFGIALLRMTDESTPGCG